MVAGSSDSVLLPEGYEFVRMLGHGASGWVALARQVQLDRLVAIKAIHAGGHDRLGQRRLEREGRAVVALRHPGIVAAYELRQTASGAALVMEYVPGGDLRASMESGTLSGSHAAALLGEIAAALAHAHAAGIIHRDVKPANVLLSADGHAKIADFGLARLTRTPDAYRTSTGGVSGTPAYIAPEQILDASNELPASDTYAFAVLAYEMLTGARPFPDGGLAEVIAAHLYAAPALAKHPQERPSPVQIADEIRRVPPAHWDAFFRTRVPPARSDPESAATSTQMEGSVADPGEPFVPPAPTLRSGANVRALTPLAPDNRGPGRQRRARARAGTWRLALVLTSALAGAVLGLVLVLIARRL